MTRAFLLKYREHASKVKMAYFFATPTEGSPMASLASLVSENPQFKNMYPMQSDNYLADLQRDWLAAQFKIRSFCAYETKPTYGVQIVEQRSASNLCTEPLDPVFEDHINIVKPAGTNGEAYIAFLNAYIKGTKDGRDNPKSLYGLYMDEFANKVKDRAVVKIEVKLTKPGLKDYQAIYADIEVQRTVYLDFDAHSEFIGFYLSQSPFLYDICASLPDKIQGILLASKEISLGIRRFGDKEIISQRDMKFSSMVYVYYEGELSIEQLGSLAGLYKNKGLVPQFRGYDYAIAKSVQEAASH